MKKQIQGETDFRKNKSRQEHVPERIGSFEKISMFSREIYNFPYTSRNGGRDRKNCRQQLYDAIKASFWSMDGGFTVTLPYGGVFIPQKQGFYMCIGTEHDGHKPIFGIQGVDMGEGGIVISPETVSSPVAICNYLEGHENLTRELEGIDAKAPVQTRGKWYYYIHEKTNANVKKVIALSLGHWGELDATCADEEDIFFVLDNTTVED